jgi:hypothetical protein
MQYVGISKIDSKKIFLLDIASIKREIVLKELGI